MDKNRDPVSGMQGRRRSFRWVLAIPIVFLGVFFVYPLTSILWLGLSDGGFPGPLVDVITDPSLRGVAWFTIWQAVVSTGLTLVVALPGAYVLSRYEFAGRRWIQAAVVIPFVLPTVVVAAAFLALVGPRSPVDLSRTVWVILAAHVFFNYAVVVRTVGGLWQQLDPSLEEAARVLGASRLKAFLLVTLPRLRPALLAAVGIVFLFTFTSFGVVLILGGPGLGTIEVEIWRQTTRLANLPTAAALAVVQLIGITGLLWWHARTQAKVHEQRIATGGRTRRRPTTTADKAIVTLTLGSMALLLGAPLATLVVRSLSGQTGATLANYRGLWTDGGSALFIPPGEAITNSMTFAVVATVVALIVGTTAAVALTSRTNQVGRWFDVLLMLPLGTSAVTIGFGFLVALDWPIDLRTSIVLIPLAHALVATPFVVRAAVPVLGSIRQRLREAAAVLGASPGRVWREVDFPIVARALGIGAGFAFAVSIGEFGATSFIARPDRGTIPLAIFRLLGQPGAVNFGRAMALSVILMLITTIVIVAIDRLAVGDMETL